MLTFNPVDISSRDIMEKYLRQNNYRSCEVSFTSIFAWSKRSNIEFAEYNGFVIMKTCWERHNIYLFPMGSGDLKSAVYAMERDALNRNIKFRIAALSDVMVEQLEQAFPGEFQFIETRNWADYLYRASDLIELSGKKYHSKRNFINRFTLENEGRYAYHDLLPENIPDIREFLNSWSRKDDSGNGQAESDAIDMAFSNFEELDLKGGFLTVDGNIVAVTAGSKMSADTWDISIEKADYNYKGSYQMINWSFVKNNCAPDEFINREDDMGIEGLRKAKLSYYPFKVISKYTAVRKNGN